MKNLIFFLLTSICFAQSIPVENSPHQVLIKWVPPKNQTYDGFHIYRADSCHSFVYLKNVGQVKQFVDKAVIGGETYKYKVRTVLNGTESNDSNIPSVTVPLT